MKARRWLSRLIAPLMGFGLLLTMTACGGGSKGSGDSGKTLSGAALVTAAKKEGTLTWYTSYTGPQTVALAKAFNQKYPGIKVNPLQGTADKLTARLITEQKARKHNADLFQADASYGVQLINTGALQPYDPPDALAPPSTIDLPKGYRNIDAILTTVIAYNPTVLKQKGLTPPKSLEDLTKPAWRGQFSADATGVNWYESLISAMGHDKAKQLITALGHNKPVLSESHTEALTQVQSGEPMATIAAYGYLAASFAEKTPKSVGLVNTNPLPSAPDVIEMVQGAPHPNAARLFMDWLLSKEGQQAMIAASSRISLRPDVADDKAAWNTSKWKPAWSEPGLPASDFTTYSNELKAAFKAP